jgi:DNA repair exonuclease SbcCD nuclease subunit
MIGRAASDLHLTPKTADWVFAALRELSADAAARGGFTVLAGDILDQPKTVDVPTYNRLRDILRNWPGDIFVLPGNHDQYSHPRHALEALDGGACRIVNTPEVIGDVGLLVPYQPPSSFWDSIRGLSAKVWWTHQGWQGAYLNAMTRDRDGLDCGRMDADLCVSGHYHCPQQIGRIVYCGSPFQGTFAEEGQIKGWLKWDGDVKPQRVAYTTVHAPRHWTVEWVPGTEPAMPPGWRAGDRVRLRTTATRDEVNRAKVLTGPLSGAAILSAPRNTTRIAVASTSPVAAAHEWIERVCGPAVNRPDPAALAEWAEEVRLWG